MRTKGGGLPTILVLLAVGGIFAAVLWVNSSPTPAARPIVPTQVEPTAEENAWQRFLAEGIGENSTPLPTVAIPEQTIAVPVPVVSDDVATTTPVEAAALSERVETSLLAEAISPTPLTEDGPESTAEVTPEVVPLSVTQPPSNWRPAPLKPPINRDPLGRDHFWLQRPVDSNANNAVLAIYPYGSDGPYKDNPYRIHHGIDMPNDIGRTVRAAGSGVVIWAADGRQEQTGIFQGSGSYGNVIFIEHDFSYEGQPIYTLYAHLSAALVQPGQYVEAGEAIGLIGDSGVVSGPHVHFEVRVGSDRYGATYNPVLWMVPYVGHGVIAGRVLDERGELIEDIDITVRNWATGLVHTTTTSYIMPGSGSDVNPDPQWRENFAVADVPTGRYDLIVTINGERVIKQIEVLEGRTNFIEIMPPDPATPEPIATEADVTEDGG